MKIKRIFLGALLMLGVYAVQAQNADNKWGLGLQFGTTEYSGDYDKEFYTFKQGWAPVVQIGRYLNPSFDLMASFHYDMTHANDGGRLGMPTWLNFDSHMFDLNLLAKYKFNNGYILKESSRLAPFIMAGVGGTYAISTGMGEKEVMIDQKLLSPDLYGGVGLNLRISQAFSFSLQTALLLPFTDKIDGTDGSVATAAVKGNDKFLVSSIGVVLSPGKKHKKDTDGDGVIDKLDKCPDTPKGVPVDATGCPLDSDNDGVYDYLDKCPNTPAGVKVNAEGCPVDTDKDGIADYQDDCPEVFGLAAFNGCPDSDGDGVPDKDDRCPNTPKGYKVDKFGCPLDSDRDGIPDSEDDCPDKAGVAELKGCPFTVQAIIGKYNLSMKPIYFDFDSYKLKPEGVQALEQIATALSNHKDFGVQFDGHTDYVGAEEYNLKLSDKRANSAKTFLIDKGISESQIRLQHFGETKPAADNKTSKGRALNRRVEYSLFELGK